jgi:beta-lactamase class D
MTAKTGKPSPGGMMYKHSTKPQLILVAILLMGCATPVPTQDLSPKSIPSSAATATAIPSMIEKPELASYFQGFTGAFVLYNLSSSQTLRYNPNGCAEQILPASTFKILNALIGLDTGVIPDENYVIQWDGTIYPTASWNQDHTLKTAMQNSVVWYYQELARRVGKEKMQQNLDGVGYGNQELSGKIDEFWLDGSLKISADQQIIFLKRLYQNDLPFSQRSMQIVRQIILLEKTDTYQLSGKIGSGQMGDSNIGWFVGYLEKKDDVYFFATNIACASKDAQGLKAKEISLKLLSDLGLIP